METPHTTNWRSLFDKQRQVRPPGVASQRPAGGFGQHSAGPPVSPPHAGYDDGYDPTRQGMETLPPQAISDHAAMALSGNSHANAPQEEVSREYRPWILQRGGRPVTSLHLRRFDPRAGRWQGWVMPYPFLAAEYVGDGLLSLDFGTRQFMIEGRGLGDAIVAHLHDGTLVSVQEHTSAIWPDTPIGGSLISHIKLLSPPDR